MRVIGITGSIACGKTTVSNELIRRGYHVIDGDALSRELTGPGGPAMNEIASAFGSFYIQADGSLNRREMGRLVFSDPRSREQLDRIMAPYLQALTLERIESARQSGARLCFLDMPLLYEKGYDRYCNAVWCVWIPEDLQLRRLMERDGYTRDEALSRMRAVMSTDEKADRSTVVIDNSGTIEDTLYQVSEQLRTELSRAEGSPRRRRTSPPPSAQESAAASEQAPSPLSVPQIDRPDSSRKKQTTRRASWDFPVWLRNALILLSALLAVCFTAQMLMKAYLTRRGETHRAEQQKIDAAYPLHYEDLISLFSAEYNISPSLIAAIMLNESSFNPSAESPVGARGLMQLMPETAGWIAEKLRAEAFDFELMYRPEPNVRFGCWYLNYLCAKFNGDPLCVVCAYHAGQGAVSGWLTNPLYSSDGQTLIQDAIPIEETKIYAGRVIRDYGIYQAKYFNQDSVPASDGSVSVSP